MKTLRRLVLLSISLTFVACSGGKKGAPPPNQNLLNNAGKASIQEALKHLNAIDNGACDRYGRVILALQITRTPTDLSRVMPFVQGAQEPTCDDHLKNAIWLLSHALNKDGTPWINNPGSQQWMVQQIGVRLNALAGRLGINPQVLISQRDAIGQFINQNLLPRLGANTPGLGSIVSQYINN